MLLHPAPQCRDERDGDVLLGDGADAVDHPLAQLGRLEPAGTLDVSEPDAVVLR